MAMLSHAKMESSVTVVDQHGHTLFHLQDQCRTYIIVSIFHEECHPLTTNGLIFRGGSFQLMV